MSPATQNQMEQSASPFDFDGRLATHAPLHIVLEQKEKDNMPKGGWTDSKTELVKWILGTVILGGVGLLITKDNNDHELDIKRVDIEVKRVDIDVKTLQDIEAKVDKLSNSDSKLRYLEMKRGILISDVGRECIDKMITQVKNEIEAIKKANAAVAQKSNTDAVKIVKTINPEVEQKLKFLARTTAAPKKPLSKSERPISSNLMPLTDYKQATAAILGSTAPTPAQDQAIKQIAEAKFLSLPVTVDNYELLAAPETKWCKAGYYVVFNNTLKVGLIDVTRNSITFHLNELPSGNPIGKQNLSLNVGEPLPPIFYGEYKYLFSLDYIGKAGRNPFTQAAYITVTTYQKKRSL
jgi:hypothetical protein